MKTSQRYSLRGFGSYLLRNPKGCSERQKLWYFHCRFSLAIGVLPALISMLELSIRPGGYKLSPGWSVWDLVLLALTFLSILIPDTRETFIRVVMDRRAKLAARSVPRTAERLLWLFLPPETCEEAIDDINARFEKLRTRYGVGFARRWYCWQVVRSVSPTLDLLIERLIK